MGLDQGFTGGGPTWCRSGDQVLGIRHWQGLRFSGSHIGHQGYGLGVFITVSRCAKPGKPHKGSTQTPGPSLHHSMRLVWLTTMHSVLSVQYANMSFLRDLPLYLSSQTLGSPTSRCVFTACYFIFPLC